MSSLHGEGFAMPFVNSLITYNGIDFSFTEYSHKKDLSFFSSPVFQNPRDARWMLFTVGQNDDTGEVMYASLSYDGADHMLRESYSIYGPEDVNEFLADSFRDEIALEEQRHDDPFRSLRHLMGC